MGYMSFDAFTPTKPHRWIKRTTCRAHGRPATYTVTPPDYFGKPWLACEDCLPPMKGISYREYRDAVRPIR